MQYALEGSVFIAGAAVQWLRDELGLIKTAAESETRRRQRARIRAASTSSRRSWDWARRTGMPSRAGRLSG